MNYAMVRENQVATARLEGRLDESIQPVLDRLAGDLSAGVTSVTFDCQGIDAVNSPGVRQWLLFVKKLPKNLVLQFSNCPADLMGYILMLPGLVGKGKVYSFIASFSCSKCGASEEQKLTSKQVVRGTLPRPRCMKCDEVMASYLDEGRDLNDVLA